MSKETTTFTDREKNVLGLLDTNLRSAHDVIGTLERKAQYCFTLISAMAASVALININVFEITHRTPEDAAILCIAFFIVLYLGVAVLSILTLWPREIDICPLEPTRENIEGLLDVECVDWDTYCNEVLAQYADIYQCHRSVMEKKSRSLVCSYRLVGIAIFVVLLEIAIYVF